MPVSNDDIIKIWADNGYGKMVSRRQGNANPRVPALPPRGDTSAHGIYYHASFYDLQAASHITMLPNSTEFVARELADVMAHGLYNRNLQAVPPTGSISYINNSTSSIHPIVAKIEIRKEGKIGRVYYPAPFMTNDNLEYYQDAYEIGYEKIIDTYAAATQHVDQGLSLTLFFKDTATTRDINRAQIYAWRKGIKTLYYIRIRQQALEGTEVQGCVSCML